MPPYRNCSFYQIQFLTTFEGSCTCFVQVPSIFYIIGNIILKQHSLTTWYFNILNKYVYNKIYYKISIDSENHCVIIIMYLNKVKLKRYEGVQKCKSLKPLGLYTHTHTHTGYITKINRLEPKKNIWLFSNVLFLHTQKVCEK